MLEVNTEYPMIRHDKIQGTFCLLFFLNKNHILDLISFWIKCTIFNLNDNEDCFPVMKKKIYTPSLNK